MPAVLVSLVIPQIVDHQVELRVARLVFRAHFEEGVLERGALHLLGDMLPDKREMLSFNHDRESVDHHEFAHHLTADSFRCGVHPGRAASVIAEYARLALHEQIAGRDLSGQKCVRIYDAFIYV